MATPFTALDGADAQGVRAEVWVQTGDAQIDEIKPPRSWKPKEGGDWNPLESSERPSNVSVKFVNEHIRDGISGWISTADPLYAAILEAFAAKRVVEYRVEWQRNKDLDRATPVKELRGYNEQTRRSDMGLCGQNGKNIIAAVDGQFGREAVTNPAEDAQTGGRVSALERGPAQQGKPQGGPTAGGALFSAEQALAGLAQARKAGLGEGVVDAAVALALIAGATPKQVQEAGVEAQGSSRPAPGRRGFAVEAPPHVEFNTDGRVNLGSYAVHAAFGAERVAYDLMAARHEAVARESGEDVKVAAVDLPQAASLADVLLRLADLVQVNAYGGGQPDRMKNSHSRARNLVFDAVQKRHPVPFGGDPEAQAAWKDGVVEECVERFQRLVVIAENVERPATPVREDAEANSAEGQEPQEQEAPAQPVVPVAEAPAFELPEGTPMPGEDGYVPASEENIQRLRNMVAASQIEDQRQVGSLIRSVFGVGKSAEVHDAALAAFVAYQGALASQDFEAWRERFVAEAAAAHGALAAAA